MQKEEFPDNNYVSRIKHHTIDVSRGTTGSTGAEAAVVVVVYTRMHATLYLWLSVLLSAFSSLYVVATVNAFDPSGSLLLLLRYRGFSRESGLIHDDNKQYVCAALPCCFHSTHIIVVCS